MPSSLPATIQHIIKFYEKELPSRILDVGFGWGKYGLLAREYLNGKVDLERLDGIEVWKPYIGPIQRAIYDNIYEIDVRNFVPEINYDLVLMVDVIEHMDKSDGLEVFNKLRSITKYIIVSTPMGFSYQGEEFNNPYEVHRSGWMPNEFDNTVQVLSNDMQFVLFLKGGLYEDKHNNSN